MKTTVKNIVGSLSKIADKLDRHATKMAAAEEKAQAELSFAKSERSTAEAISGNIRSLLGDATQG